MLLEEPDLANSNQRDSLAAEHPAANKARLWEATVEDISLFDDDETVDTMVHSSAASTCTRRAGTNMSILQ